MIKRLAADYPEVSVMRVKVDCDGLGVGVYDNLYEQMDQIIDEIWTERVRHQGLDPEDPRQYQECMEVPRLDLEIVECHFGGAGGKVEDGDPVEYSNSTGLMWGKVRKYLQEGRLKLPDDDTLFSQLSNRKYIVGKDGKLELERKEAMKKRGVSSPDIADALALALYDPNNEWTLEWS